MAGAGRRRRARSTSGPPACRCCATWATRSSSGEPVYDITFENVQAGERTSHLFRLANFHNGLVLGTGDLSELALGWATYGVGDQMSHYNVNASVPKTLIQYLIRWVIATGPVRRRDRRPSCSRSWTPRSRRNWCRTPATTRTSPAQSTQAKIGPYELQDFNLYYITRYGFRPSKVAFLSHHAWRDKTRGDWPDALPRRASATSTTWPTIKKWLARLPVPLLQDQPVQALGVPNGPKVGSGGSLSPRGDWRAPSDSEATVWLEELQRNVPDQAE